MERRKITAILYAVLAAVFYAINMPLSKLLLKIVEPTMMAALCWGFENNCTRKISSKNNYQIVMLKGIFSGLGFLIIALIIGEKNTGIQILVHDIITWFCCVWVKYLILH